MSAELRTEFPPESLKEKLGVLHDTINLTGITFVPDNYNRSDGLHYTPPARLDQDILRAHVFNGVAEADRQAFVDDLIRLEVAEDMPGPEYQYVSRSRVPTRSMIDDRATMRAVLLAVLERPSEPIREAVAYRYDQLTYRDDIFMIPFAGRLDSVDERLGQRIAEYLGNRLGWDIVLDRLFLENINSYQEQPWGKDYAFQALSNPTAFRGHSQTMEDELESFGLKQQDWYPEAAWLGHTIMNSIKVLARDPRDNLGAIDHWESMPDNKIVHPYRESYNPIYLMWTPPTNGGNHLASRTMLESITRTLTRHGGERHDLRSYGFAAVRYGGGSEFIGKFPPHSDQED